MNKRNHIAKRRQQAHTLIEMLVAVSVIAIAIAGLGEMLWINGAFMNRLFNKADNIALANVFFATIGKDIRSASNLGDQTTYPPADIFVANSKTYTLGNSTLILQIPYIPDGSNPVDAALAGYPVQISVTQTSPALKWARPVTDTVIYDVEPDPNNSPYYEIVRIFIPDPSYANGRNLSQNVVLTNIEGPINSSSNLLNFDYVANNGAVIAEGTAPFSSNWATLIK